MKIAIASNDLKHVTGHLGRCKSFIIYNAESGKITGKEIRQNTFTHHSQGDHGQGDHSQGHHHERGDGHHHSHATLVDALKDCEAVIFQSGGWRVIEDLKAGNIVPFLTDERIADEAVEKYLKGELSQREDNACDHNN